MQQHSCSESGCWCRKAKVRWKIIREEMALIPEKSPVAMARLEESPAAIAQKAPSTSEIAHKNLRPTRQALETQLGAVLVSPLACLAEHVAQLA